MTTNRRPVVSVVGSGDATAEMVAIAEAVGCGVIEAGARLVTGGGVGVMEAASRGARRAPSWTEGSVVGILPGYHADSANLHVDVAIPTGLGHARNVLVVSTGDVVVVVGGAMGALSEVALARKLGKPVVAVAQSGGTAARVAEGALGSEGVLAVQTAEEALAVVRELLGRWA